MEADNNGTGRGTAGQKALRGWRLHKDQGITQDAAARICGTTARQIQAAGAAIGKRPELEAQIANGELTLNAAQIAAGYRQHKPVAGQRVYFGKGDKWVDVANAMLQYLQGWKTRDYKFTHVPPKEAERRVQAIDDMIAELHEARADLEARSVKATSSMPHR